MTERYSLDDAIAGHDVENDANKVRIINETLVALRVAEVALINAFGTSPYDRKKQNFIFDWRNIIANTHRAITPKHCHNSRRALKKTCCMVKKIIPHPSHVTQKIAIVRAPQIIVQQTASSTPRLQAVWRNVRVLLTADTAAAAATVPDVVFNDREHTVTSFRAPTRLHMEISNRGPVALIEECNTKFTKTFCDNLLHWFREGTCTSSIAPTGQTAQIAIKYRADPGINWLHNHLLEIQPDLKDYISSSGARAPASRAAAARAPSAGATAGLATSDIARRILPTIAEGDENDNVDGGQRGQQKRLQGGFRNRRTLGHAITSS